MKNIFLFLVLFFFVTIGYAQQYPINQTLGSPTTLVTSRGGFKADSSFILPAYSDTNKANANPYVKNYAGSLIKVGNTLYVRSTDLSQWISVGAATIPTLQQVTTAGDISTNTITVQNVGASNTAKLKSNGMEVQDVGGYKANFLSNGFQSIYQPTNQYYNFVGTYPNSFNNQTLFIPKTGGVLTTRVNGTLADSSGNIIINTGSGTVTSIATGYGLSGGTITNTGTLLVDSSALSNKYLRLNDTASMLSPYSRTNVVNAALANKLNISDTASMLTNYFNKVNYGLSKSGQTISVDSATLSNKYLRIVDTANKWVNSITRTSGKDSIIYFIGGTRYAIKDSVGGSGTVTSVGLTMPSAFTVSNSPVTGSGTIGVTGSGTVSQYVRGNGTLADFPTSTGGGASVSYYLNGSVSKGTIGGNAYKQLNSVPVAGAGTDFTINADGYIAQFITDSANPNKLSIPAGNWNFETYFSASSSGGSPSFYIELYKYDGTTFTLIASNSATPENITGGTSIDLYFTALAVPSTTLLATDRLAVRFFVTHSGRTITMHTEDSHLSQIITTFSTGLTALNGLTAQVQNFATGTSGTDFGISSTSATHTFNLPDASATARGVITTGTQTIAGQKTFTSNIKIPNSGSQLILQVNSDQTVTGMPTSTYPSPSELAYVKGVTSAIQTQINNKVNISDTATMLSPYARTNVVNASLATKQSTISLTTSGTSGAATFATNTLNIPDYSNNDALVAQAYKLLGSSIKGINLTLPNYGFTTGAAQALASGTLRLIAYYLPNAQTITGVKWWQSATASYTATNYNGVGLYSYSGGTLTLVASSTNDGTIWQTFLTNTMGNKAFTTPYSAAAGVYFIGLLHSASAGTAPSLSSAGTTTQASMSIVDFTNSAKLTSTLAAQTSLPSSQAMSGTTISSASLGCWLY